MKYQCNVCGGDACRTGFLGDDLIPEHCPYNSDFVPEWRPVKNKPKEDCGAEIGDIVAYVFSSGSVVLDRWDGIRRCNGKLILLISRAEVEHIIEEAKDGDD